MGNAPLQMGLKTDKQSYQHGETMTGTVFLQVNAVDASIQSYTGIRLQFAGVENTEVRVEEGSGNDRTYRTVRESSSILRVEVPMTNFSSPLRVAKYEFPFEWKLPDTPLPSSFRHHNRLDRKGNCEVKYTLTAYLVPQESGVFGVVPNSNGLGLNKSNKAACASQTIHFVGATTRSMPEPINIAEERTTINRFCCCWKQGQISLGWEADTIVLSPGAPCHLQIWGSNQSALPVQHLRVQLVQSVKWQAGNDFDRRHTRSNNSTLIDYNYDVSHMPQWDPVLPTSTGSNRDYQAANQQSNDDAPNEPAATSFQVPSDVMDSYQGLNCTVEHSLIVTAVTAMMATTPTVSYTVHLQRAAAATSGGLPVATAWMEEAEYTDAVLPSDWAPDEKVPVIHLREIVATEANATTATAQAVVMDPPVNPAAAQPSSVASLHPSTSMIQQSKGYPPAVAAYPTGPPSAAVYPPASFATANSAAPLSAYPTAPAATPFPPSASATPYASAPPATPFPPAASATAYASAAPAAAVPSESDEVAMDFARPTGMTDDIVPPTATAPMEEGRFTDLEQFQNILRQIDINDMSTYRSVEHQLRSLPACQRVLSTMTPEDYQYLCQAGTPITIARISYLLAAELNKGAQGFRGAFMVALMQLPVAQETSISLIGSLTEQISDLEQSADYVQQTLRPDDAKWFKQRVDDWAY